MGDLGWEMGGGDDGGVYASSFCSFCSHLVAFFFAGSGDGSGLLLTGRAVRVPFSAGLGRLSPPIIHTYLGSVVAMGQAGVGD